MSIRGKTLRGDLSHKRIAATGPPPGSRPKGHQGRTPKPVQEKWFFRHAATNREKDLGRKPKARSHLVSGRDRQGSFPLKLGSESEALCRGLVRPSIFARSDRLPLDHPTEANGAKGHSDAQA
jgi:hypothetical protein